MADIDHPTRRAATDELRPMAVRRSVPQHVAEIFRFRELLWSLTRKELTVRYKHSALGFLWSMVQPLFLLVVYASRHLGTGSTRSEGSGGLHLPSRAILPLAGLIVLIAFVEGMRRRGEKLQPKGHQPSRLPIPDGHHLVAAPDLFVEARLASFPAGPAVGRMFVVHARTLPHFPIEGRIDACV